MYGEKVANAGCSSWSLDCGTNKSNPHMKKKHSFCDDIGVYCAITKLYFLVPPLTSNLQYIFSNRERIDEKGKCERDDVTFCFIFFFLSRQVSLSGELHHISASAEINFNIFVWSSGKKCSKRYQSEEKSNYFGDSVAPRHVMPGWKSVSNRVKYFSRLSVPWATNLW